MRKLFLSILISISSVASSVAVATMPTTPIAKPGIKAKSYLLIDANSDEVLVEHDIDKRVDPASLTKMMTVYVIDQELKQGKLSPEDEVSVSKKAWKAPGSRMFIEVDSKVKVKDLIQGIIIQSGNDASIAMAEHIGGSESGFVSLMNVYAKLLKMEDSHFTNVTGLTDEQHYSTARDMAKLAKAIIREFPETYKLYSEKSFTYNGIKQYNRNRLLWRNQLVDGIKTGYTEAAGFCLVSSAVKDDMRLISVVMGTRSEDARSNESHKLLSWGFRFYETHKLYSNPESLQDIAVWQGKADKLAIGLKNDLYITVPQGQYQNLSASVKLPGIIKAPIQKGQQIGTYVITKGDEIVLEQPVISLIDVAKGSLWKQFKDKIKLSSNALLEKMKS